MEPPEDNLNKDERPQVGRTLEEEISAVLRRLTRATDLHSRTLLSDVGLTSPQLAALKAIERLQPVAVTTLARESHLGLPTMTGILQRLERRGMVVRERDESDRRSIRVKLTESGRGALYQAPSPLQEHFRREFSQMRDWEQSLMLSTLQRFATMLEGARLETAGRGAETANSGDGGNGGLERAADTER